MSFFFSLVSFFLEGKEAWLWSVCSDDLLCCFRPFSEELRLAQGVLPFFFYTLAIVDAPFVRTSLRILSPPLPAPLVTFVFPLVLTFRAPPKRNSCLDRRDLPPCSVGPHDRFCRKASFSLFSQFFLLDRLSVTGRIAPKAIHAPFPLSRQTLPSPPLSCYFEGVFVVEPPLGVFNSSTTALNTGPGNEEF